MNNVPGTAGNDILIGDTNALDKNDLMNSNWSAGDDTMAGGTGNDSYNINSAGDQALENAGAGYDSIMSRATSFDMSTNATQVEAIRLDNTPTQLVLLPNGLFSLIPSAVNAIGNALDNLMTGNDRDNTLSGRGGHDSIYGYAGNDTLNGDDGNDYLNGGAGNDTINGGFGNDVLVGDTGNDTLAGSFGDDTYWVDSGGDVVTEGGLFGGTDLVNATVNVFALAANVENLTLYGTAVYGYGNGLANVVTGNSQGNVLLGLAGDDRIKGLAGSDTLYGGDGNDLIDGGTGADYLYGNGGFDRFMVDSRAAADVDRLIDFAAVDDTVVLMDALDNLLPGAVAGGIKGLTFAGGVLTSYFEDVPMASSGIYYYGGNGELWYNASAGVNGDEFLVARMNPLLSPTLTNADFVFGA